MENWLMFARADPPGRELDAADISEAKGGGQRRWRRVHDRREAVGYLMPRRA
jgi:hypothetical protein